MWYSSHFQGKEFESLIELGNLCDEFWGAATVGETDLINSLLGTPPQAQSLRQVMSIRDQQHSQIKIGIAEFLAKWVWKCPGICRPRF